VNERRNPTFLRRQRGLRCRATFYRDHVSFDRQRAFRATHDPGPSSGTYLEDEDYEFRMANLQPSDGEWFLHASMREGRS